MNNQYQSESIAELATSLAKAQAQMEGARQDSKNPFFKSDYADLTSVWNACRKPLTDHGLAIVQTVEPKEDKMILVTTLAHASGQWMKSYLPLIVTKMDPQGVGASITYARRFALAAIVGICPKDDDAEEIMKPVRETPSVHAKLNDRQCAQLDALIGTDEDRASRIATHFKVRSLYDIQPKDFEKVINALSQKKMEKANVA